jgi:precorrin-3B methylase
MPPLFCGYNQQGTTMKSKEEIMIEKIDKLENEVIKRLKELRTEVIFGDKYTYDIDNDIYTRLADKK